MRHLITATFVIALAGCAHELPPAAAPSAPVPQVAPPTDFEFEVKPGDTSAQAPASKDPAPVSVKADPAARGKKIDIR